MRGGDSDRYWILVARNTEATICLEDPLIGPDRYVYVEADAADVFPIARGIRSWAEAAADGSVRVYGEPELVAALPGWFLPAEEHHDTRSRPSFSGPQPAIGPAG
jgi:hypothetical protein